jgi:hypothetical protein
MDGVERFAIDFNKRYRPYPKQSLYHESSAQYRFLGGAAGPGKTACGIVDQMIRCNRFGAETGPLVHTLLLRRTQPQLESTVITRFRELIPSELYKKFNQSPGRTEVVWKNGATTRFGSMQYESDVWSYQGQWLDIFYDELCEFTFTQWNGISAWNRCPVSKHATKGGAGNPIGIGALWVEDLFVKHCPCDAMDDYQKTSYDPSKYAYFPCTYLDNPIYANDPTFVANLMSYPEAIREAMMMGKWGLAGGYFRGVWDESIHIYPHASVDLPPWFKRWISGNWGYEHPAAFYKHCMDEHGVLHTYDELYVQHLGPEQLAEAIGKWAPEVDMQGKMGAPDFISFAMSFDAWASKQTATMGQNSKSVASRMMPVLKEWGIMPPHESTRDKMGRDTLMHELLNKRIRIGETAEGHELLVPAWRISDRCTQLKRVIPISKRDDPPRHEQVEAPGDGSDSPLQGCGYGLYDIFGKPAKKPEVVVKRELWAAKPERSVHSKVMQQMAYGAAHSKKLGRSKWAR